MSGKWLRLHQLTLPLTSETSLPELLAGELRLKPGDLLKWRIHRLSLDARGRGEPRLVYIIDLFLLEEAHPVTSLKLEALGPVKRAEVSPGSRPLAHRPVVVGLGPAGLFAALRLAEYGYRPLVLERGEGLASRVAKVENFWRDGILDPDSNMQFGSGGAGTFSDGKLVTRIRSPYLPEILAAMVETGAPPEIEYWHKPHVGTDRLRSVVEGLQERIIRSGGEIRFHTRMEEPVIKDGRLTAVRLATGEEIPARVLILATGHSARDLYDRLAEMNLAMEAKPFAVGVRVEHPQKLIDRVQYGRWAGHPRLGPADYRLTFHHRRSGRGVYSFCMCPGGLVVAAASEENGVVTNGMSYYARDSGVANAALVVTVGPGDFAGSSVLAGVEFQRYWERKAYELGGGGYKAPVQKVKDFLAKRPTRGFGNCHPTYRPGVTPADLHNTLPPFVSGPLEEALRYFNRLIPGFAGPEAVLTGVETRTSAPVRIIRGENRQSPTAEGLYPCGEGSGYAGGIISSAVDGMETADRIIREYAPPAESGWV